MADNEPNGAEAGQSQEVPFRENLLRYVELALGYLGFLVLIGYPVAVATTIKNKYYSLSRIFLQHIRGREIGPGQSEGPRDTTSAVAIPQPATT